MDIMTALLLLCLLSGYIAGSQAQHSVKQDPAVMTTSPGQDVRLPCDLGGGLTVSGNCVHLIQQKEGETPTFIMYYCSDSNKRRGEGVPTRFVVSGSGSRGYLDITGVQEEDQAVYYCFVWTGSQWIFGGGTRLDVPTGEVKAPALFIFGPSAEELQTDSCSTVCTATDFNPGAATIQWAVDGNVRTSGVSTTPIGKQSGSLYMVSSILTMPTSDYRGAAQISCKVTHQGKEMDKTLKTSECN